MQEVKEKAKKVVTDRKTAANLSAEQAAKLAYMQAPLVASWLISLVHVLRVFWHVASCLPEL